MSCKEFSEYLIYCLPTFEPELLPAEAQDHLDVCPKCRAKIEELRAGFILRFQRKTESARQVKGQSTCRSQLPSVELEFVDKTGELPAEAIHKGLGGRVSPQKHLPPG